MKTKNSTQYRQGDVLIERIAGLPANLKAKAREHGRVVLAHGEVTGHAHAIADREVEHYDAPAEQAEPGLAPATYLEVRAALAALHHEEHSTIDLPAGSYRVTRQREYAPEALRNVAD